ncbi:MAG: hypothetical protein U1E02_44140 [Hydrogenophaga sp.]|nr:hypothetical protein [Hydrogenophaga sp.]
MNNINGHSRWFIILAGICVIGGALFYAIHQEWLFFFCTHKFCANTMQSASRAGESLSVAARKKAALIFWRHDRWAKESQELVWPADKAQALTYLLNSWFTLLDEEHVTEQKVTVQTVLMAHEDKQALISFDRIPFAKESSTFAKWLLLEGLLKTIRENGIAISEVVFLIRHQPLRDYQLDFTNPWKIEGFFENQN